MAVRRSTIDDFDVKINSTSLGGVTDCTYYSKMYYTDLNGLDPNNKSAMVTIVRRPLYGTSCPDIHSFGGCTITVTDPWIVATFSSCICISYTSKWDENGKEETTKFLAQSCEIKSA